VLAQLKQVEANINKDLAAGLITQGDAATQLAALNQAQGAYTDSKIAELLLTDSVLDKTTTGTASLNVLVKQAELRSEVSQLDVAINVAEKQLQEETRQIDRLHQAITTAKQSPYYLNASGQQRLYFAFVPYDNQADAVIGSAVYDCYSEYDRVSQSRLREADIPGRRASHPSHLQDSDSRLSDPDESGSSGVCEIKNRVPGRQARVVLASLDFLPC
jgi:hypothetical protein